MKTNFHYYKQGHCWDFVPRFFKRWGGKLWHFSFWRFQITLDFRKNWIADMCAKRR